MTKNYFALIALLSTIAALLAIGWYGSIQERIAADRVIASQADFIQELLADAHEVSAAQHQQRTVQRIR